MFFRHKAPRFFRLNAFEQLRADAVHLRGMQQMPFFLASALEGNSPCMKVIMTGLTQRQQIRRLITSVLASENNVMHFEPLIFEFPLAVLAGVAIPCQHISSGISKAIVNTPLIQPLLSQHLWVFERMWVKGSCFQHNGRDWQ